MTLDVIESRLDMQCVITISNEFPIERFSREFKLFIPGTTIIGEDKVGLLYYLPDLADEKRDVSIFLRSFKARKNNDTWIIYTNSKVFPQLNFFKELVSIPSIVFDTMYLEDGVHNFFFRFHHNYTHEVSKTLLGPMAPESMSVEYFGKSGGIASVIDRIKEKQNISCIKVRSKPPDEETKEKRNPIQAGKWFREVKANFSKVNVRSVYFVDEQLKKLDDNNVVEISRDEGIYEAKTENSLLSFLSQISDEIPLPSIRRTQYYDGHSFTMNSIIPEHFKKEYLNKVSKSIDMFPEWEIILTKVQKMS